MWGASQGRPDASSGLVPGDRRPRSRGTYGRALLRIATSRSYPPTAVTSRRIGGEELLDLVLSGLSLGRQHPKCKIFDASPPDERVEFRIGTTCRERLQREARS